MRIYFDKKEHEVIMTDGLTVKAYNGAPSGFYEGIDLCADDAAEKLKDYFANAELNDYDDIWCDSSSDYAGCEGIISESELVFDSGIKRIVYSVTDYNGEDGFNQHGAVTDKEHVFFVGNGFGRSTGRYQAVEA